MKIPGALKLTFWKAVAIVIIGIGLAATIQRFVMGLGAVTNLRDDFPWGLWIGFDILVGVGLAAGGFLIAATVYVFNIERFRPILRPTILTAFLGYILVIVGLLIDLGRPWAIWHALIMWNPKSVMFEVAWCVMLYTTVLALEFSPVVFEKFKMQLPLKILKAITIPLVIAGVILSTLHQSSLGSLFLVVPTRMHPLWYSEILPFLFIISCVAAGLSMTIVESFLSSRAFGREIEMPLLTDLSRVIVVVLALYLIVRIQDLINRDALKYALEVSYQSVLFFGEVFLGVVVPTIVLLFRRVRTSRGGLFFAATFAVLGFIAHRVNVAVTSMEQWGTRQYTPSVQEFFISAALVAAGIVVFGLVAKYFNVFTHAHAPEEVAEEKEGVTEVAPARAD